MKKEHSGYAINRKTGQASRTFTMVSQERRATQGSRTSTRAVGCSLKGSAQILLNGDGVVLLNERKTRR